MEEKIQKFLDDHDIKPNKQNGRSYIFDCPACGGTDKLYIEKKNGKSICFKHANSTCPSSKHPSYALSLLSGLDIKIVKTELFEQITPLKDKIEVFFDKEEGKIEQKSIQILQAKDYPLDSVPIQSLIAKEGQDYLLSRGIDIGQAEADKILYSPSMRRIIFQVIMDGKTYGWQGRAIDKVDKKYRMYNLPGEWKAQALMMFDNIKNKDFAILAEGPVSAMKFGAIGGYVASMGKLVSSKQLDLLIESGIKRLYLALDRDAAMQVSDIKKRLGDKTVFSPIEIFAIPVPEHRDDFGDCTYLECVEAFKSATKIEDQLMIYMDSKRLTY